MNAAERIDPVLQVTGLVKDYADTKALVDVTLSLDAGEVRALMGVNGAGKSTLVKILGGVVLPTGGTMTLDGAPFAPLTPASATAAGIAIVHQELSLVPGLTVAENITLGRWPTRRWGPVTFVAGGQMQQQAREALSMLGEDVPLNALVGRLSPAKQQLVEIAKALLDRPRVLILDEPTSSLAAHEVDELLTNVRRLASQGVAVLYVSHRMDEIPRVADTVTVLRDGREIATRRIADMGTSVIASLMLGDEVSARPESSPAEVGEVLLDVAHLSRPGVIEDVSFSVRAGEVVGMVGLMGSGRTEILRAVFGLDRADGTVSVRGREIKRRNPRTMIAAGVGFTPEDRKSQGLVLGLAVSENLVMTCYDRVRSRFGVLSRRKQSDLAHRSIRAQSIDTRTPESLVGRLSGGNQQKVVIGKWLNRGAEVLLMDEPTRGVDVHAKNQTYETIKRLAREGGAVVFVSSEAEEVFLVCQRILVVHEGRVIAERRVEDTDTHEVLALSMKLEAAA